MPIAHRRVAFWLGVAVLAGVVVSAASISQSPAPVPQPAGPAALKGAAEVSARVPGAERLLAIDTLVHEAIADGKLPGAVVIVGRAGVTLLQKAYGQRAVAPTAEPMTLDTIFDISSLTKVVATAPAVMQLVETGRLRLSDRAATFIPEFGKYGKDRITIHDLLTHMSGLRAGLDLADDWSGRESAIRLASEEVPVAAPGQRFLYSDINFMLLAEIVARVSTLPFDTYVRTNLLQPLGMYETTFLPPSSWISRIAPTQPATRRGTVHDPTAERMGGVTGHAGLFSTAGDLARFCQMWLDGGAGASARVLSPLSIGRMTSPATPLTEATVRGLGWDLDSTYSSNRGDLLPLGSFGHTGFTGTSLWIDPATRTYIVFLSNRVHPDGAGDVTPLRAKIANVVGSAIDTLPDTVRSDATWSRQPRVAAPLLASERRAPVATGIDVLRADGFAALAGLRIGLVTNHTGLARDRTPTIDLLASAPNVRLTALFSPEHGIRGILDAAVPSTTDAKTRLPIHSLYGTTRRPTADMLAGLDAVVIDLQDVGARFYTYMTTMAYVMEEAAARKIKVFVLDRPNPIGGVDIEGPALDASAVGFTGYFPAMPIRHGLTMGELARLFNGERAIGANLTVVSMKDWRRDLWFDDTGLSWINPSPNMRSLYAATLYPGIGAFEQTNISVGRGTDTPFEHIGAPWIDGVRLADVLNARRLPGVRFYPVTFTPTASVFANQECSGVFIVITDRQAVRPVRVGAEIAGALATLYPTTFRITEAARLFGSSAGLSRLAGGDNPAAVAESWAAAEARWRRLRAKYLLYF